MPLAKLVQYQHCLLRRNGVRTEWSKYDTNGLDLGDQLALLRLKWSDSVDADAGS
jgi:hypothetical protein